ncbi:hypothetical protein KM043_002124 [Ampulex compressa]|nr:hypothetical protein KM043_002124 [Ampulex compressa]
MQLPGGSTRIPPARAPASILVIINGSNIAATTGNKRVSRKSSRSGGSSCHRSKNGSKSGSRGNSPDNEPTHLKRSRHPETRTSRRHRATEKPQLLASTPRRKERGEE